MTRFIQFLLICGLGLSLAACSGSPAGPEFIGSSDVSVTPGQNPANSVNDGSNGSNGGSDNGSADIQTVSQLIDSLSFPAANSEGFFTPDGPQLEQFQVLLAALLAGNGNGHEQTLSELGYQLTTLEFDDGSAMAWALHEPSSTGGGTFLINPTTNSDLILEVPHPLSDAQTLEEAAFLFQDVKARALYIAGAHRCANAESSPCSGTTNACGTVGPHRVSDAGHFTETFFHAAHMATDDENSSNIFISLHAFESNSTGVTVNVSNGTSSDVGAFAYVNQLASAFDGLLETPESANSCNRSGDSNIGDCGASNIQSRYTNGSADECTQSSAGYNGRFIHFEQSSILRSDQSGWQIVAEALNSIFN